MGSVLARGEVVVWPGDVVDLLGSYDDMEALLAPDLVATDLVRRYFISTQYQALVNDLEKLGFHEHSRPPTLYACPYDWRKPNEVAAATLSALVERAFADHAGEIEITLLGHSMGGLVCRYYLESGRFDGRDGFGAVRMLVTVGTPHRGAPEALPVVLGRERRLWLSAAQVRRVAEDPRYPSAYQLLPHRGEPFAWNEDPESRFATLDVYAPENAARLGLSADNLAAASSFHAALQGPRDGVRYFCFAGTRQATTSLVRIRSVSATDLRVRAVELRDAGDGTVPDWSGRMTGVQSLAVGGGHSTLYKNGDLRRTLGPLLGAPQVLAAEDLPLVELALREPVVEPRASVRGLLRFPATAALSGELRLERARQAADGSVALDPAGPARGLSYRGLTAESLGFVFEAPSHRGAYRVAYYAEGRGVPAASDELFVVDPAADRPVTGRTQKR